MNFTIFKYCYNTVVYVSKCLTIFFFRVAPGKYDLENNLNLTTFTLIVIILCL